MCPACARRPIRQAWPSGFKLGSQLLFQVHYVANGSEQLDCCKLGLVFADKKDVECEVITSSVQNRSLVIPPGAANYELVGESSKAPTDCKLLCMMPPHARARIGDALRADVAQW